MSEYLNYFNKLYSEHQRAKNREEIRLLPSQLELLKLLASGLTLKEIAIKLDKKYENIKKRTQKLYIKLKVTNRGSLIRSAIEYKLISTKDVKSRFRKRFVKNNINHNIITETTGKLTENEKIFLKLLSLGKTQNEIIQIFGFYSPYLITNLRQNVCKKLDCKNLTQAVYIAKKLEFI